MNGVNEAKKIGLKNLKRLWWRKNWRMKSFRIIGKKKMKEERKEKRMTKKDKKEKWEGN